MPQGTTVTSDELKTQHNFTTRHYL